MNIILEPDVERWIGQEAARAQLTPELYIAQRLQEQLNLLRYFVTLPNDEAQLLSKINEGFSVEFWQRYRELIARRQTTTLTESEHTELIALSDQVEQKNAERVPYLFALAQRRNISLNELVQQLGLRPTSVIS